jgi:copper chaperone CopZ
LTDFHKSHQLILFVTALTENGGDSVYDKSINPEGEITMKPIAFVLLFFATLLIFSGCSKTPEPQTSTSPILQTVTLDIEGITWGGCVTTVQVALEKVPGVSAVHVDMATNRAVVQLEKGKTTPEQLIKAVDEIENIRDYRATVFSVWPQ